MEIILHAHHADVTNAMRRRAEAAAARLGTRLRRAVTAIVRFEGDGPAKRVEIVLQSRRRRDLVAQAFDRRFGPALSQAVHRLEVQVSRAKRSYRPRTRLSEAPPG